VTPFTPVSAMNAPSMMIGMRAARFIQRSIDKPVQESSPWPA
jgi:hypothetical protein